MLVLYQFNQSKININWSISYHYVSLKYLLFIIFYMMHATWNQRNTLLTISILLIWLGLLALHLLHWLFWGYLNLKHGLLNPPLHWLILLVQRGQFLLTLQCFLHVFPFDEWIKFWHPFPGHFLWYFSFFFLQNLL